MKAYYIIVVFALVLMTCQSDKKEDISLKAVVEKETTTQEKRNATPNDLKSQTTLTKEQFNDFFPKEIDGYELVNVSVLTSSGIASAMYVKGKNYNHTMTYSLEDGNRKGSAIIRNFENSYNLKPQGPAGAEYLYKERDGYKTIAFLQPQIKRNDIRFIYNNRFRLTLEGTADVETLWSYFKDEDLQKLDVH
ncbi:MAG: hypothetical protein ACSHXF_00710 [Aquaticitalea sp.]